MNPDLTLIGMEKGKQYETIISTKNHGNISNAAPIGVICSGQDKILCRIFKGGTTLSNILSQKEFIVNITHDPELFLLSTIGNLPKNYFDENNSIKNVDAYFKCEVINFRDAIKKSDPIRNTSEAIIIKSRVIELVINNNTQALNRGIGYVIESLVNLTRFDIVTETEREYYIKRFKEANRIVTKIGYKKEKDSMDLIKEKYKEKGYEI